MSLIVPFDNSPLAKAALVRARQFDQILEEGVIVVSVIPAQNAEYARERGWIGEDEPFDGEQIVATLREAVEAVAPDAEFEYITVDRFAPHGVIGNKIRKFARNNGATIVFLGSQNAGRIVRSTSVGASVVTDRSYDTMVVSGAQLPEIPKLEEKLPVKELLETD
ncbi:universal stress protein [Halovenus halobia]|uniref:universal stress protein n=1 Tax=Halovenus halobia TaxID=3396622 RepID=UPI003F56B178